MTWKLKNIKLENFQKVKSFWYLNGEEKFSIIYRIRPLYFPVGLSQRNEKMEKKSIFIEKTFWQQQILKLTMKKSILLWLHKLNIELALQYKMEKRKLRRQNFTSTINEIRESYYEIYLILYDEKALLNRMENSDSSKLQNYTNSHLPH